MPKRALIVDTDTLRAIGLRSILTEYFGVECAIALPGSELTEAHLYIVTPDVIVAAPEFFMPRGRRTIVLSTAPAAERHTFPTINPTDDENRIAETIGRILTAMPDAPASPADRLALLTAREVEVLRLVAAGHINKEIASALNISFNTVLSHRKNITAKLGIRSSQGLAVFAMMNGLLPPSH